MLEKKKGEYKYDMKLWMKLPSQMSGPSIFEKKKHHWKKFTK